MKRGFTLIELIVVVAMIMIITGAMTVSVQKARTRAMIAKATQETREMTNAILAYEQYAKNRSLADKTTGSSWATCTEGAMSMILGRVTGENGEKVPVLFNAVIRSGELRDPWGTAYEYMIDKTADLGDSVQSPQTAAVLPNVNRLTDKERGAQ